MSYWLESSWRESLAYSLMALTAYLVQQSVSSLALLGLRGTEMKTNTIETDTMG